MANRALRFVLKQCSIAEKNNIMSRLISQPDLALFTYTAPLITVPKNYLGVNVLDSYLAFLASDCNSESRRTKLKWLAKHNVDWVSILVDRIIATRSLNVLPALLDPANTDKLDALKALGEIKLTSCRRLKESELVTLTTTISAYNNGTLYQE